jgi:hypothetical protein
MTTSSLMLSMLYSTIGLGMFIYGKKTLRFVPLIAGLLLMVLPYFLSNLLWMSVVSILLMVIPFFIGGEM